MSAAVALCAVVALIGVCVVVAHSVCRILLAAFVSTFGERFE